MGKTLVNPYDLWYSLAVGHGDPIEEQTRDHRRMDVVVHYLGRRYIIELKIWHGDRYNADGEKQISEYLDRFGLTTGYMLSFNFNKNKEPGVKRVQVGDRILFEGMV